MNLIRWKSTQPSNGQAVLDPWREFDRMFGQLWVDPFENGETKAGTVPVALDVTENESSIVVRAEVAGVAPEALEITLEGDVLTIAGEKQAEKRDEKDGWHRTERRYGSFRRSLQISTPVDTGKVEASHSNGVVTITLHKSASALPKRIEVKKAS